MTTAIQTRPFFNNQPPVAGPKSSRDFSDAVSDLEMSAILPDPAFDNSLRDALPQAPRQMRPRRFAIGLVLTTIGMSIILLIGVTMLEVHQPSGSFALPLVVVGVLSGIMLLGGGFGLMATASSGFDEREFDRLMKVGNIASAEMDQTL